MTTPAPLDPKHDPSATTNRFSGVHPDNTYPLVNGKIDDEQEKRKQARQEGARTKRVSSATPRPPHPPLTSKFSSDYVKNQQTTTQPGVS